MWRCYLLLLCALCAACTERLAMLAPDIAQPITRPSRNFTSFDGALRCMDGLLRTTKRPTIQLSSTGIVDQTRRINVAGDDMLINALVRMTQTSRAYVFLDQGLVSAQGLIDLLVVQKENTPRPSYYVRGAISQLDQNVAVDDFSLTIDNLESVRDGDGGFDRGTVKNKDDLSVVSVDLHLVSYPSRQVVPGASVSNSMVVRENARSLSTYGVISMTGVDLSLKIDRLESTGQAVRNLIEVSLIELIGKHARVPYWTCLAGSSTDASANSSIERGFVAKSAKQRVVDAQTALRKLGRLTGPADGVLSPDTVAALARFQAEENLLVNGIVDFDTWLRLQQRAFGAAGAPPPPAAPVQRPTRVTQTSAANSAGRVAEDETLRDLLPPDRQRTERRDRSNDTFQPLGGFLQ